MSRSLVIWYQLQASHIIIMLRALPSRSFSTFRLRRHGNPWKIQNVTFVDPLEQLDSSIDTMNKILSILNNAESQEKQAESAEKLPISVPSPEEFRYRFYSQLGNDVFKYKALTCLNERDLIITHSMFREVDDKRTLGILHMYISMLMDPLRGQKILPKENMEQLGMLFGRDPRKCLSKLTGPIEQGCTELIGPSAGKNMEFGFPLWIFVNVREDSADPLFIRKALSAKTFQQNIPAVMINDENVVNRFVRKWNTNLTPRVLSNFMAAQAEEGSLAFKILVKKHLQHTDPQLTIYSPFESFHHPANGEDSESDIDIVKAIVASRSKLLQRLMNMRSYKQSLRSLREANYDTNEKIIKCLANLFDRYFGACYKNDAKYCDGWAGGLVEFYLKNGTNERLFKQLFGDAVRDFQELINSLRMDHVHERWAKEESKTKQGQEDETKMQSSPQTKRFEEFLKQARKLPTANTNKSL